MAFTTNQISDAFQSSIGRAPTDYETTKYATANPQDLANLKTTFGKLNTTQSIADYLTSIGQDSSLQNRLKLYQQYGITPDTTGNYYNSNIALMKALKGGQTPGVTPSATVPGTVSGAAPLSAPIINNGVNQNSNYDFDANGNPISRDEHGNVIQYVPGTSSGTPGQPGYYPGDVMPDQSTQLAVNGSIGAAATPPGVNSGASNTDITQDPNVTQAKTDYTTAQKAVTDLNSQINDLNNSINTALANKRDEISKSGGIVDESQLRSTVLAENAPLLAERNTLMGQRSTLISQQTQAQQAYTAAQNDFYKSLTAQQSQEKIGQSQEKIDTQQTQFTQKEQDVAAKLGQSGYKLASGTDAAGNKISYWVKNPGDTSGYDTNGQPITVSQDASGNATVQSTTAPSNTDTSNPNGLSVAQYGLLANVKDFNPNDNQVDKDAYNYLMSFLGGQNQASGSRSAATINVSANVQTRAAALYTEATGQKMPAKSTVDQYTANIASNVTLQQQLDIQTGTIQKNFGLNLDNMTANNVNTSAPIMNGLLDFIAQSSGSASVAQYLSQHETLANELASLLAVKNTGGGTTVADKLSSQDLLPANSNVAQAKQIVQTLMAEAQNQSNTIINNNAKNYIKIDGLGLNSENPVNKTITLTDASGNSVQQDPNTLTPQQLSQFFDNGYEITSEQ